MLKQEPLSNNKWLILSGLYSFECDLKMTVPGEKKNIFKTLNPKSFNQFLLREKKNTPGFSLKSVHAQFPMLQLSPSPYIMAGWLAGWAGSVC